MLETIKKDLITLRDYIDYPKASYRPSKREVLTALSTISKSLQNANLSITEQREIYSAIEPFTRLDLSDPFHRTLNKIKGIILSFPAHSQREAHNCIEQLKVKNREKSKNLTEEMKAEKSAILNQYQWLLDEVLDGKHTTTTPQDLKGIILKTRSENSRRLITHQEEMRDLQQVFQNQLQINNDNLKKQQIEQFLKLFTESLFVLNEAIYDALQSEQKTLIPTFIDPENPDDPTIKNAQDARMYRLEHLEETYQNSQKDPSGQVFSKYFPETFAWFVGIYQSEVSYSPLQVEMQKIAEENGIILITEKNTEYEKNWESYPNQLFLDCSPIFIGFLNPFLQDCIDFCKNGQIRLPRMQVSETEKNRFKNAIIAARKHRWEAYGSGEGSIESLGIVFHNNFSTKALALTSSLGASYLMNLTYNEGGNTLFGKNSLGPYVIIGKDTYEVSKFLMEKDLGRSLTHEEICKAFASDYGIDIKNIFFIEQPGDFHLDMSMAVVGEKIILLNDSKKAQEIFQKDQDQWLNDQIENSSDNRSLFIEFVQEERENAVVRNKLELKAKNDLEALGFKVILIPGKFNYSARTPAMNLFNMVTATTPEGKKIVVMLGCPDKKYEQEFEKVLREYSTEPIDKVYFLDFLASQQSLLGKGGISCRTKTIGFIRS